MVPQDSVEFTRGGSSCVSGDGHYLCACPIRVPRVRVTVEPVPGAGSLTEHHTGRSRRCPSV